MLFENYNRTGQDTLNFLRPGDGSAIWCLKDTNWTTPVTATPINVDFVYDGDGGRVEKLTRGSGDQVIGRTTYIGSLYDVRDTVATKHIFCGANRIASVESAQTYFFHGDHLGSSNIITDKDGNQVSLTEYTPYGTISVNKGDDVTNYKFTGKELDSSVGLYYYGARYYDPILGRFTQADTIVPNPSNPQDFNRYSYCNNNPINYTDPTGHSWKKFWHKVENFFKDEVLQPLISFSVAFVFSGFNPVAGIAAAMATITLDTGEGRQFVRRTASSVFDDALGMRPGTAYIWSSVISNAVLSAGYEIAIANLVANPAVEIRPYDAQTDSGLISNPKGIDPFGRYPGAEVNGRTGFNPADMRVLTGSEGNTAVVGLGVKEGGVNRIMPFGKALHLGASSSDLPASGMMRLPNWSYGTVFGTCQQATNATLLRSGFSNTVMGISGGNWATYATTLVYGNYGGGLPRSVYAGIKANDDY